MLFLPALSAACGLEAQEEIFPGNKFRYTELRLEGTLPVSGYPTPLYLFRRAGLHCDRIIDIPVGGGIETNFDWL